MRANKFLSAVLGRTPNKLEPQVKELITQALSKSIFGEAALSDTRFEDMLGEFAREYMTLWHKREGKGIAEKGGEYVQCEGMLTVDNPLFDPEVERQTAVKAIISKPELKLDGEYIDLLDSAIRTASSISNMHPLSQANPRPTAQKMINNGARDLMIGFAALLDQRCQELSSKGKSHAEGRLPPR